MSLPRSSAITKSVLNEKEWPIELYRRTMRGWEKHVPATSRKSNGNQGGMVITAIPREGCIIVRKLRLRICLRNSNSKTDDNNKNGSSSSSRLAVIRRRDRILISSNRRVRALILKFRNVEDCQSFADHLVMYNPPPAATSTSLSAKSRRSINSTNTISQRKNAISNHYDKKEDENLATTQTGNNNNSNTANNDSKKLLCSSSKQKILMDAGQEKREIFSYIVRLLHDNDFMDFVNNIENCIASSVDGNQIIRALAGTNYLSTGK